MIRLATREDAEKIFDLFSKTQTPWPLSGVISSLEKDCCLVFEEEKIVSGVIVLSRSFDECEVLNFAVETEKRGKGIGNALLEYALCSEFTKDAHIFLDVRESNSSAIYLYKKFGFVEITVRKNYYTNPIENAIIMKLER